MGERPLRILVGKAGLDGHDRGAKVVVRGLREAGFDVVYSGLHRTPGELAEMAVAAGVDAVGLSLMSGAHLTLFPEVLAQLARRGAGEVVVFGGGILPAEDIRSLERQGVARIFGPGTPTSAVVAWLRAHVAPVASRARPAVASLVADPVEGREPA